MDLGGINPVILLASLMVASVPILLAALGELVVEKSGVLNLGVEGMMVMGAVAGFGGAFATGNPWVGVIASIVAGMEPKTLVPVNDGLVAQVRVSQLEGGVVRVVTDVVNWPQYQVVREGGSTGILFWVRKQR